MRICMHVFTSALYSYVPLQAAEEGDHMQRHKHTGGDGQRASPCLLIGTEDGLLNLGSMDAAV